MKQLLAIALVAITAMASAQTYRTVPKTQEQPAAYDSLSNIPEHNLKAIYGQTVLVLDTLNFHPVKDVFKPLRNASIVNQKFILDTASLDSKSHKIWMIMRSGTDTIYYQFSPNREHNSFITMGYLAKQEQLYIDKLFTPRSMCEFTDINIGSKVTLDRANQLTCTGTSIVIDGQHMTPSIILQDKNKHEIAVPMRGFETDSSKGISQFIIQ